MRFLAMVIITASTLSLVGCSPPRMNTDEIASASSGELQAHLDAYSRHDDAYCSKLRAALIDRNRYRWPPEFANAVIDGAVQEGMTHQMVRIAWGKPHDVRIEQTPAGRHDIWQWGEYSHESYAIVRFHNGEVIWWEAVRN
jgi:outer membrane murein-binding lipoprotein Lpp